MRKSFVAFVLFAISTICVAATILAVLYTSRIASDPSLRQVGQTSDPAVRTLAANLAYREQVRNKTAVPRQSLIRVNYADGSSELYVVTAPLFSLALDQVAGSLRNAAGQLQTNRSPNSGWAAPEINIRTLYRYYEIWRDGTLIDRGSVEIGTIVTSNNGAARDPYGGTRLTN